MTNDVHRNVCAFQEKKKELISFLHFQINIHKIVKKKS